MNNERVASELDGMMQPLSDLVVRFGELGRWQLSDRARDLLQLTGLERDRVRDMPDPFQEELDMEERLQMQAATHLDAAALWAEGRTISEATADSYDYARDDFNFDCARERGWR